MTQYIYWINAAVPEQHVATADAFGALIGSEPGDAQAFSKGVKLRSIGDQSNAVVAYGVAVAAKQSAHDAVQEFNGSGPWPTLNALGASDQAIAAGKAVITVESGARASVEGNALAFWSALGFEPVRVILQ